MLEQLRVAVENRAGYDRALFALWSDLDNDGCDTRQEVLAEESVIAVTTSDGCRVVTDRWLSLAATWTPVTTQPRLRRALLQKSRTDEFFAKALEVHRRRAMAKAHRPGPGIRRNGGL